MHALIGFFKSRMAQYMWLSTDACSSSASDVLLDTGHTVVTVIHDVTVLLMFMHMQCTL